MGGGRISLVGTVESAAADMDALDPQALQVRPGDRETIALDQSTADGPTTGGQEEPTEAADLRTHQAGLSAQAPHPGEDRQLGREVSRLHGSRLGLAFREFGRRRAVLAGRTCPRSIRIPRPAGDGCEIGRSRAWLWSRGGFFCRRRRQGEDGGEGSPRDSGERRKKERGGKRRGVGGSGAACCFGRRLTVPCSGGAGS